MTEQRKMRAPEVKSAADQGDVTAAFEEFMTSFEAFKEANDEKLGQLERRGADPVTVEKVERISRALDAQKQAIDGLALKKARPALGRGGGGLAELERKQAFDAYMRSGDERSLRALEEKSMSYGSGPDGGYLVPDETEAAIGARLADLSPIRSIASVRQVSSAVLKKPFAISGPVVGWVAETAARPETASSTLDELQFPTAELYAMPAATAALLDDSVVDLDQWIAGEVEAAFAEQEGAAFVNGNGVNKPRGFLNYTQVDDGSWNWGNVGYNVTGVSGALPASDASDVLVDLVYALKAGYRQNASWVMNRKTQATLRKLKDADGNYMWQPPATPGSRAMLMGFPLVEAEDMPDIGADTTPIAFGDFRRFYLVVDRMGIRVLRDPYSAKPYVLFYTTKRVGGGIQDFEAAKLLKFGIA
ncbi:phage major capsid protein [Nitratireductor pacificus]|uniref:HK97 family major capsid protein n=1 Tax=Nitratireductor pacificus pht-3B TaxID=391937 RepID=K2N6J2_9HYPH|nr:phage major capsid protein [Nitratireductor pacificus]EKF19778.1 HK97 family major capsid protein [Nitratireductor pacificus pht-3B]